LFGVHSIRNIVRYFCGWGVLLSPELLFRMEILQISYESL